MASHWIDRRVVATGLGVVSSLGQEALVFWENIVAGKCGIRKIAAFDVAAFTSQIAAEVRDFDPVPFFPSPKEARHADPFTQFATVAAHKALIDSHLDLKTANRDEIGAFVGSGIGGLHTTEEQHKILLVSVLEHECPHRLGG